MNENINKLLKDKFKKYGLIPAYILFILIGVESLARLNPLEGIIAMIFNPFALVINFLIIMLCFLFLLCVINNKYIGSSILLIVSIILGVITKIKYDFRGTGSSPLDFLIVGEGLQMANALSTEFLIKTGIIVVVLIIIAIFLIRKMIAIKLTMPQRLCSLFIVIIFYIPLYFFTPEGIIIKNGPEILKRTAMEVGAYFYFVSQFNNKSDIKELISNEEDLKIQIDQCFGSIFNNIDNNKNSGEKPDIIYIQSESFFDPTEELGIENFSEDPLPFYHNLKNESDFFKVTTPVYGGDTVNAEFEMLTGLSLVFFPRDVNIFLNYLKNPIISLGSILRANDYYALSLHPYMANYYNRNVVYKYLGFNQFNSLEVMKVNDYNFANRAYSYHRATYVSDIELSNQIIENLKNNRDRNNFIFAISVQTHVPFVLNKNLSYNVIYTGDKSTQKSTLEEFNGYLRNLKETDDSLRVLIEYLKARDKYTIVVFYGDHQPRLKIFPYVDSLNTEKKQLRHEVGAFIWSNKEILKTTEHVIDMTLLGEKGLSVASVEMPNYFYILKNLREEKKINSFNSFYLIKDGQYYFKGQPEYEEIYKDYFLIYKDILEGERYIEKENNKWLIENNINYKGAK